MPTSPTPSDTPDRLAELMQKQAQELVGDNSPGIAEELQNAEDGKLGVSVSFKLALIGRKVFVTTGISYSRKFKDETEGNIELPDPSQPGLL